ncbi:hypothetical protein [Nakamurella sp. PAMC28650]|uniref:hypothetical protein n=1 Tax=Nakamurella sp. PAMC28650 TaxID=2762325 RepID=UPI00164D4EFB|nr:hypothetical protein [Nakamurella sp. PAMC28650]QNK81462.1 hypothetical protein H7F38_00960 [Nakamurella sp. PAMC28650]
MAKYYLTQAATQYAGATAAIVLGDQAPAWLTARRLPSRLVDVDGVAVALAGWPDEKKQAA